MFGAGRVPERARAGSHRSAATVAPGRVRRGHAAGSRGSAARAARAARPRVCAFGVERHRANELEHSSSDRDASARFTGRRRRRRRARERRGAEAARRRPHRAPTRSECWRRSTRCATPTAAPTPATTRRPAGSGARRARARYVTSVAMYTRGRGTAGHGGPRGEELAWALHSDAQDARRTSFGVARTAEGSEVLGLESAPDRRRFVARAWLAGALRGARRRERSVTRDAAARHRRRPYGDLGGENPLLRSSSPGRDAPPRRVGLCRASDTRWRISCARRRPSGKTKRRR